MDQGSNDIRQTIEDTRESLTEKLDALESKARQTFDLKHQVAERPWLALGAAVATGYVLGSLGGGESEGDWSSRSASGYSAPSSYGERGVPAYKPHGDSFLSQFDDEIDMLKGAAMTTLTSFIRDALRELVPAMGGQQRQTGTPSTAQGASMSEYDRANPTINSEAIPTTTSYGSNAADRNAEHATPYYPPGSADDAFGTASRARERSVGDEKQRY
ncbi:MAG TPA: hypothetical protein PLO33_06575 [Kouleothrix sp.]|uniref:hypothetical protein n=1 Tax=Kouleothrix sp. TaxID=2779161 RepID=UPI002C56A6AC|nr:hypothetical protein [Kouleothrix sp.]HRC75326.1 hypothetical protein [Kouleothrix sp.]